MPAPGGPEGRPTEPPRASQGPPNASANSSAQVGDRKARPPAGPSPRMPVPMLAFGGNPQFSEKDLEKAQLPPPPEENAQLDTLLRLDAHDQTVSPPGATG